MILMDGWSSIRYGRGSDGGSENRTNLATDTTASELHRLGIQIPDLVEETNQFASHNGDSNEWLEYVNEQDADCLSSNDQSQKFQFSKVAPILRKNEKCKQYYDPRVISIGPYHHGKPELQPAEELKTIFMHKFISQTIGISYDELYCKVFEVKDYARSCYVQGSTDAYDDPSFTELMLRDGCFIIHYIDIFVHNNHVDHEVIVETLGLLAFSILFPDIFLLENQLPFRVLQVLMRVRYKKDDQGEKIIKAFIKFSLSATKQSWVKQVWTEDEAERPPRHLLELYRRVVISSAERNPSAKTQKMSKKKKLENPKDFFQSYRSVTELKAKGIHVRPSSSFSLRNTEFKSYGFYGLLRLPPMIVTAQTKIYYTNLIAYELSPDSPSYNYEITSYVGFVSSLINGPEDVKELRSKNIILNSLGSDLEVAKMFKEIARGTFSVQNFCIYHDIRESIQKRYDSKMKTWMAEVTHKYFSSPWTALAFLAAIYVLLLSSSQTVYTIWPRPHHDN